MAQQRACVIESDRFDEAIERVRLGEVQEVRRGSEGIVGEAKQIIIRDDAIQTGDLYRSVHAEYSQGGTAAEVVADVPYASYVHDGTRRMPGRPFFTEAVRNQLRMVERRLREMFKDRV